MKSVALAAAVVFGLALAPFARTADAGLSYAVGGQEISLSPNVGEDATGPDFTGGTGGAPDGSSLYSRGFFDVPPLGSSNGGAIPASVTYVADFDLAGQTFLGHLNANQMQFHIWTLTVIGAPTVTSIELYNRGGAGTVGARNTAYNAAHWSSGTLSGDTTLLGNAYNEIYAATDWSDVGNFSGYYDTIRVTFVIDFNESVVIDALSNPEPGTLALFGLGALGIAGAVARRRRRRAVVAQQ